ncbi:MULTISPECIES: glycosyl hydrolase family 28-related protein [unclassified Nonomuraea]|uniref:glycosyl hydrolase family 28-related protein n=1 Tax=unclassified Nonomuraea TaxID=2593643 RepID=UPI0033FFF189
MVILLTGATIMAVADKPAARVPIFSVRSFGAIPGDGLDDSAAMQRAADRVCAIPGGATLYYPRGVYNINKIVDLATIFSGNLRAYSILYKDCRRVWIRGEGARIEVKGDFEKKVTETFCYQQKNWREADKFQFTPFSFQNVNNLTISGFEIDGNVDQMTQSDPNIFLCERNEYGIFIVSGVGIRLTDLNVHHMATDGILLGLGKEIEFERVRSTNNIRDNVSIGQARNVLVTDSDFHNAGVGGTAPNSYPFHSPGRGVNIEPECYPKGAGWAPPGAGVCSDLVGMTGNILFDSVRVTGNLGGGIAMAHGESTANVTVRNSFLQNPLGKSGDVTTMGIVGGVVEDSTLDSQNGFAVFCVTGGVPAQLTSSVWTGYLQDLANDPSLIARRIHRQTDPTFSTTLQRNTITGQATKFLCQNATPRMTVVNNKIRGVLLQTPPEPSYFRYFGHMVVFSGTPGATCSTGLEWAKQLTFENNDIFIPHAAPRPAQAYGEIGYCGTKLELTKNTYRTDTGNATHPLRVYYNRAQGVGSVAEDCFPASGAIIAVDEDGRPYPLTTQGTQKCLTLPQPSDPSPKGVAPSEERGS